MSFYTHENVYCPVCPATYMKRKPEVRTGVHLELAEQNYSGCCVDIAQCPECGGIFGVTYKVAEITTW